MDTLTESKSNNLHTSAQLSLQTMSQVHAKECKISMQLHAHFVCLVMLSVL